MNRRFLFACLAPALLLVACTAAPPASPGDTPAPTAVDRADQLLVDVEQRYAIAKATAGLVVAVLPPEKVARIRAAEAIADSALVAARAAVTLAARIAEIRRARAAADSIAAATRIPAASTP